MKILAFETSDSKASVALYMDGTVFTTEATDARRHAETTLCLAEELLAAHGLQSGDMDAFAVDVGPGSFTGIRIGVCLVNALAVWCDVPVFAVSGLEALAYTQREGDRDVWAVMDARNGNAYAAQYHSGICLRAPFACTLDEIHQNAPPDTLFIGTAAPLLREGLFAQIPNAEAIARIAAERMQHGDAGQKAISPLYLRPAQAERLKEAKVNA